MVCKEEVLTWFKDLDSYKRIDLLCELINMCLPFELRFLGSYVEETGKHSYQELRQQALAANDVDKLDKDPNLKSQRLSDETVRHRMLINVSLLKSRNYNVANWYSKNFLRTEHVEVLVAKEKDELVQNELLLLFTMAARHPAFSFEQKEFYNRIVMQLYELRERANKFSTYRFPPGFEYPNVYRNLKAQEGVQFSMGMPLHPQGFPPHLDYMGHFRAGWPAMPCGAPTEVPPFSHPPPPPQPPTSPLVSSPNQSRCGSPRQVSRTPAYSVLTSSAPTVSMPPVNLAGILAPGLPGPVPTSVIMTAPVTSCLQPTVPMDALGPPPPLGQPCQPSAMYSQGKPVPPMDNDELNATMKEESTQKPPPPLVSAWLGAPTVNPEAKQINGLRIAPSFPPAVNIRNSLADHIQTAMTVTDESSHCHSSSSSSPLQTPPDTPSNLAPNTPLITHRTPLEKNRVNGIPNYPSTFGGTTSPPPPQSYAPPFAYAVPNPRFFSNPNFRPPVTTVFGQFGPNQPFQGAQTGDGAPPFHHPYQVPYLSLFYSLPAPHTAVTLPPANQPGCYNCGAAGHVGQDCPQQNIDDITQKNTYSVDFSPGNSDSEK